MGVGYILLKETLRNKFNLIVFEVNHYGEEHEHIFKMSKKTFLKEICSEPKVQRVDDFPLELINDVYYVKKDGKIVWIREEVEE